MAHNSDNNTYFKLGSFLNVRTLLINPSSDMVCATGAVRISRDEAIDLVRGAGWWYDRVAVRIGEDHHCASLQTAEKYLA